jgi:phytoene dehydrogenase-like protein
MSSACDVAIIGAGHNALVAGFSLARAGLDVQLFEMRPRAGGACLTEELWPGMHFSTCAHILHGLHPRISNDMRLKERGLEVLERPFTFFPLADGTYWGPGDHESSRNLSCQLTREERDGERAYGAFRATLSRILAPWRLSVPPTLEELMSRAGPEESAVLKTALGTRFRAIRDSFFLTERLRDRHGADRAFVSRDPLGFSFASECVGAPDEVTGERIPDGYVRGGMGTVARLMQEAAGEAGARVHLHSRVESIIVEKGRVLGLRLKDGTDVRSRIVLSGLDPKTTFLSLLPADAVPTLLQERIRALRANVSCCKFLAVLSELPRWKDWDGDQLLPGKGGVGIARTRAEVEAAFDDVEAGRPPRAPVISFSVPSVPDPTQAKPGYHTASVWIFPAPFQLREGTWTEAREDAAEGIIDQVTAFAPNFKESIVSYKLRTPLDISRMHGMNEGCIWHIQHEGEQMVGNRPLPELSAYRAHLPGLYLCGSGQHPGGEVTGMPGHNAAQEALKDLA